MRATRCILLERLSGPVRRLLNLKRQRVSPQRSQALQEQFAIPRNEGFTPTIFSDNPLSLEPSRSQNPNTKMIRSTLAIAISLSLAGLSSANKDFITLHTNSNAWIREAIATLVLPEIPEAVTGDIALWSAIMMDDYNGDFLQGVTSSSPLYVLTTTISPFIL
jgi:hypothetical protein